MADAPRPKWAWWKAHELRINIIAVLACVFLISVGVALGIRGAHRRQLLLLIFFLTYTAYAYIRRYW